MPKPQRQPRLTIAKATSGTPITFENFAAESKIAVERERSFVGNQYPVAFWLAGKAGASATPNKTRAAKIPPAKAVIVDATAQRKAPQRPTRFTPNRSSTMPPGTCRSE